MSRNAHSTRHSYLAVLAALALLALAALAASADPVAPTSASASVVDSTSGMVRGELIFGAFIPGPAGGTVTIDPRYSGAARLSYSGVTMIVTSTISDVWFYVTGSPGAYYRITLPTSTTIARDGGGTMVVDTFRCCPTSRMSGGNRVYNTRGRLRVVPSGGYAAGTDEFNVGATVHAASTQPVGPYSGTFTVSVAYD
jgi:hypothetical protein